MPGRKDFVRLYFFERGVFMTIKEAIEVARRAFEAGEFAEYLSGRKGYSKTANRFIDANVPTDFEYIVKIGIFEFYKTSSKTMQEQIIEKYKGAIIKLCRGNCIDIWCAYMVAHLQDYFEKNGTSPFSIISQELVNCVSYALNKNRKDLENCYLYIGKNRDKGIWQEIERINHVYSEQNGVDFL